MTYKNILIVDDEDDVRLFLQDFFGDRDFNVEAAESGEEALKKMAQKPADIVFLDVMMPEMDGLECLEKIKQRYPNTKVIMITAIKDEARIQKAAKLGAADYIIKPFSLNYLEQELGKILAS